MPEMTSYEHGAPCWIDMGTTDVAAAAEFYSALFGWEVDLGPAEMGHYSYATLGGRRVAALADQQTPGMIHWATYFAVDDVDAAAALVEPSGGRVVVPPVDAGDLGRMAVVTDPGDTQFSLWQAGTHAGAQLIGEPGTLRWNELTTRLPDESFAFYAAVLGWHAEPVDFGGHDYYELQLPSGRTVAGCMPMIGEMWPPEVPNHWMVYFAVDDTDDIARRCAELGGQVSVPPTDIAPGRFAVLNDPQGGHFSIIRPVDA